MSGDDGAGNPDDSVEYFVAHHDEIVRGAGGTKLLAAALSLAFLIVLTLFFAIGAVGAADEAAQSSRIQRHGIRVSATVLSARTTTRTYISQGSRYSFGRIHRSYHSVLTVQLERTVDRQTTADIRSPDSHPARVGDTLEVLLDPKNPLVGEIPGHPVETPHGWLVLAVVAAGLLACDGYLTIKILGARRLSNARRSGP